MKCKYCGTNVPENTTNCTLCGASLKESTNKSPLVLGIALSLIVCIVVAVVFTVLVLHNTQSDFSDTDTIDMISTFDVLTDISEDTDSSQTLSLLSTESIGDFIPLEEIKNMKTYRISSDHPIDDILITDLVHTLQIRAGHYSEKSKVLAENDCGTWYIKISIPNAEDEEIYDFITSNATLKFIARYDTADEEVILNSSHILSAEAVMYTDNFSGYSPCVNLSFTEEGTRIFAEATTKYIGESISIVYDGQVISAPIVTTTVTEGQAVINGLDSIEEAEQIAFVLCTGTLIVDLEEIE